MRGRNRTEATAFVVARWGELHDLALLVEPDPSRATALTRATLVDAVRHWEDVTSGGRPSAEVRADLLGRLVGASPDVLHLEAVAAESDAGSDPLLGPERPNPDLETGLRTAWWGLSAGERAAYLLSVRAHLTEGEAAADLGMPSAGFARALASAVTRLAQVPARLARSDEGDLWSRSSGPEPVEPAPEVGRMLDRLRDDQHAQVLGAAGSAQMIGPESVLAQVRTRDRRRRVLTIAVVMTLSAALAGGALLTAGTADPGIPAPIDAVAPTSDPTPGPGAIAWPIRGTLASDPRVLAAVRLRYPGQRVLWAEDRGDRRYVLTSQLVPDQGMWSSDEFNAPGEGHAVPETHVFYGPAGTPVAGLADYVIFLTTPDPRVLAMVDHHDPQHPRLVVVAAPGIDSVEVSRTVTIARDLSLTRRWEELMLTDGVAVLEVPHQLPALTVRLGEQAYPPMGQEMRDSSWLTPDVPCPECAVPADVAGRAGAARQQLAFATGLPPSQITVEVAFLGAIPAEFSNGGVPSDPVALPPPDMRALLLRLRTPSGAVLQTLELEGMFPREALPTAEPATPQPVVSPAPSNPSMVRSWQTVMSADPVREADLEAPVMLPYWFSGPDTAHVLLVFPSPSSPVRAVSTAEAASMPDDGTRFPVTGQLARLEIPAFEDPASPVLRSWGADGQLISERPLSGPPAWVGPFDLFSGLEWGG